MYKVKETFRILRRVFSKPKYLLLLFAIAGFFYFINVLFSNWKNIAEFYFSFGFLNTIKFFFILAIGFNSSIMTHTFISLIFVSLLFGVLFSLIFFKSVFNIKINKGARVFSALGVFLGALAPGCAACGVGLASMLGLSAGILAFLPYQGLELSVFSILILSFSIVDISNKIYICDISKRNQIINNTSERRFNKDNE